MVRAGVGRQSLRPQLSVEIGADKDYAGAGPLPLRWVAGCDVRYVGVARARELNFARRSSAVRSGGPDGPLRFARRVYDGRGAYHKSWKGGGAGRREFGRKLNPRFYVEFLESSSGSGATNSTACEEIFRLAPISTQDKKWGCRCVAPGALSATPSPPASRYRDRNADDHGVIYPRRERRSRDRRVASRVRPELSPRAASRNRPAGEPTGLVVVRQSRPPRARDLGHGRGSGLGGAPGDARERR